MSSPVLDPITRPGGDAPRTGPSTIALSHPSLLLDHYRVPHRVDPDPVLHDGHLRSARLVSGGPRLYWVAADGLPARRRFAGVFAVDGWSVAGRLATEAPGSFGLRGGWSRVADVTDADGAMLARVWASSTGDVFVPFDVSELLACQWSESYQRLTGSGRLGSALRTSAIRTYYAVRPALPRPVQIRLRQRFAQRQGVPSYPSWPVEDGLHDLGDWYLRLLADTLSVPVRYLAPWPDGATWALVLTHDVETEAGCRDRELLRRAERDHGLRSSWNFVPERYDVSPDVVAEVEADGCEVGVHGLRHDGRDVASRRQVRRRGPAMRAAAARWGAEGFRSPATQRRWDLMPQLGFRYDSSYTDSDPYEPQPGGSCTYWPFFIDDLVELPITLPMDHTLFEILGHEDGALWLDKVRHLRQRGGLVLALAHPDYAHGPALRAWEELVEAVAATPGGWHALPREAAAWWRDRRATELVWDGREWVPSGPAAAQCRIEVVSPRLVVA